MDVIYTILGISGFFELLGMLFNLVLGIAGILLILFCAGAVLGFIARYWWFFLILAIVGGVVYTVVDGINLPALLTWTLPVVALIWLIVYFGIIGYVFGILARHWQEIAVSVILCYIAAFVFGSAASLYPLIIGTVIGFLVGWSSDKKTTSC